MSGLSEEEQAAKSFFSFSSGSRLSWTSQSILGGKARKGNFCSWFLTPQPIPFNPTNPLISIISFLSVKRGWDGKCNRNCIFMSTFPLHFITSNTMLFSILSNNPLAVLVNKKQFGCHLDNIVFRITHTYNCKKNEMAKCFHIFTIAQVIESSDLWLGSSLFKITYMILLACKALCWYIHEA